MLHRRPSPLCLAAIAALTASTPGQAQSLLENAPATRVRAYPLNTAVAVTTDGLWIPDRTSQTPLLHIPASSFPGEAGAQALLTRPAIEWDRRTDTFVVSSGSQLFQVMVTSLTRPAWSIEDITPEPAIEFDLWDLDIHPATGELFVLDQTNNEVLRFAPPFAAGMLPTLVLPAPGTARALALDSRSYPPAVVVTETSQVTRIEFDGGTQVESYFLYGRGIDHDPQVAGSNGSYMVAPNPHQVVRAMGTPSAVIPMNKLGACQPLAVTPSDIEWNPVKNRAYVFAEGGINWSSACSVIMPASGPNHIVRFPVVQAPPNVVPKLHTYSEGSGISGSEGDLAVVMGDFGFVSPYGEGCSAGSADAVRLDTVHFPSLASSVIPFKVRNATPGGTVRLVAGSTMAELPLVGGCDLLVAPDLVEMVGTTNAQGRLNFDWTLPIAPTPGLEIFVQVSVENASGQELTQALRIHFGQ